MRPLLLASSAVLLLGAAQAPASVVQMPPGTPDTPVRQLMRGMVNPAAELYWKAAGEVDTEEGAQKRAPGPEDIARWKAAAQAGATLQKAGELLAKAPYARDEGDWVKFSKQLTSAGVQAEAAAKARSEEKTFEAGSAVYDACYVCHGKYIPRPANSLYRQKTPDDAFKEPK